MNGVTVKISKTTYEVISWTTTEDGMEDLRIQKNNTVKELVMAQDVDGPQWMLFSKRRSAPKIVKPQFEGLVSECDRIAS